MTVLRSLLFNICFAAWAMIASLLFAPLFLISPEASQRSGRPWAMGALWLARMICNIRYEVRGQENILKTPALYASKHQSAWDTLIFLVLFDRPAYVLKESLLRIPLWGWYLWRMKMIAIDRSGGAGSMKKMVREGKEAIADSRPIVIYPEGTRKRPGSTPEYHPGVAALYSMLDVPAVPVALNSGVYWGKDAFMKHSGKIIIEFLPAIAPGMKREAFMAQLQSTVETASQRLLEEAKFIP